MRVNIYVVGGVVATTAVVMVIILRRLTLDTGHKWLLC